MIETLYTFDRFSIDKSQFDDSLIIYDSGNGEYLDVSFDELNEAIEFLHNL
jgi:hypothetical protein